MWAWGGKEVGTDGKVAINSKETIESVKFFTGFWKDAVDEGGLAWDDSNNNRAFLSGTISATLNGASIYIESLRNKEKYKTDTGALMHTDIQHAALPAGPAGAYAASPAQDEPRPRPIGSPRGTLGAVTPRRPPERARSCTRRSRPEESRSRLNNRS